MFHMNHINYELTITFHWLANAQSNNKLSIEPINRKTRAGCKRLVMMPGNEQDYNYKFTIVFNIGLYRCMI